MSNDQKQSPGSAAAANAAYPENPIVATVWRAGEIESVHRGAWCLVDSSGSVLEESGAIDHPVYTRSAIKCLQVLPLFETGAADELRVTEEEIVLAVSSHNAEPCHVEVARGLLGRLDLRDSDLGCGPQPPGDHAARAALLESGVEPGRIHNNCSGKHAAFLALNRHLGAKSAGYLDPAGPSQALVREAVSAMTDVPPGELGSAVDGCSAPTFRMPLRGLALAFAQYTTPSGLNLDRRAACERVMDAVAKHPVLLAGRQHRVCTALVRASGGKLFPKVGAEAVYAIGVPGQDRALAIKMDDGGMRGLHAVIVALCRRFDLLDEPGARALERYAQRTLRNWDGLAIGRIEVL